MSRPPPPLPYTPELITNDHWNQLRKQSAELKNRGLGTFGSDTAKVPPCIANEEDGEQGATGCLDGEGIHEGTSCPCKRRLPHPEPVESLLAQSSAMPMGELNISHARHVMEILLRVERRSRNDQTVEMDKTTSL